MSCSTAMRSSTSIEGPQPGGRAVSVTVKDVETIADFCRRHHIRWLAVFGSALREDFGPESDLDILVVFEPGHVPGLAFFGMQEELSALLGREVDLNTPDFLSPYFRDRVMDEAVTYYGVRPCPGPVASHPRRGPEGGRVHPGTLPRRSGRRRVVSHGHGQVPGDHRRGGQACLASHQGPGATTS